MRSMRRLMAIAVLTPALAGLPAAAQSFDSYMSVGDSLTAFFSAGALVETQQEYSYPALVNAQINGEGSVFLQPLIDEPGCGFAEGAPTTQLALRLIFNPASQTCGLMPVRKTAELMSPCFGAPTGPFDNVAVPGATVDDAINTVATASNPFFGIILQGLGSELQQVEAREPSLVTVWLGINDVLGAVTSGVLEVEVEVDDERGEDPMIVPTMTSVDDFQASYTELMDRLAATGAAVVVGTLPDPTVLPFVRFVPVIRADPITEEPTLVNGAPITWLAETQDGVRELRLFEALTLNFSPFVAGQPKGDVFFDFSAGDGLSVANGGSGVPIPDSLVLDQVEIEAIQERVAAFNQIIRDEAARVGAAVAEIDVAFDAIAQDGAAIGGVVFDFEFLTGGLVGFDGLHPTAVGHALVANVFIDTINEAFGRNIDSVELGPFAFEEQGALGAPFNGGQPPSPECLILPPAESRAQLSATALVRMLEAAGLPLPPEVVDLSRAEQLLARPDRFERGLGRDRFDGDRSMGRTRGGRR